MASKIASLSEIAILNNVDDFRLVRLDELRVEIDLPQAAAETWQARLNANAFPWAPALGSTGRRAARTG